MGRDQIVSDDILFEKVNLGTEAGTFMRNTPVGRSLSESALHDWKSAVSDFEDLRIEDIMAHPEKVVAIKHKMDVARSFILWMNSAIREGDSAENELRNRDMSETTID